MGRVGITHPGFSTIEGTAGQPLLAYPALGRYLLPYMYNLLRSLWQLKPFQSCLKKKSHEDTHSILNFTVNNKTPGYTKRKEKKLVKLFLLCFRRDNLNHSTKCSMWDCRQLKNANLAKFFYHYYEWRLFEVDTHLISYLEIIANSLCRRTSFK